MLKRPHGNRSNETFQSGGLEIPEDISIIGLDNIALTEIVSPELTTIELERYKIGKTAMEMLLNRIKIKNYQANMHF